MPVCARCSKRFPNRIYLEGKVRDLSSRKLCLECSPFVVRPVSSGRNPSKPSLPPNTYLCDCGESSPDKFYGQKKTKCGKCHISATTKRADTNRKKIVEYLGGECEACGYSKRTCSLDVHHLNPAKKDQNFSHIRSWSWDRILKEISSDCVLLCKRCHTEFHCGYIIYQDGKWVDVEE